jgi:hypothetical protein
MTSTDLALIGSGTYRASVTPLKTGGRRDITVSPDDLNESAAFTTTDITASLRAFFAAIDAEAEQHREDPVALVQALARLDTLAADVRAVRDSVRRMAAEALHTERVRRLVVEGVAAVESATEIKRSEWQHDRLLGDMLNREGLSLLDTSTGERIDGNEAADVLLAWFRPEWKLTPIRQAGLDPDDYCSTMTDDDGNAVRTPTLRMLDNLVRRMTTTQGDQE